MKIAIYVWVVLIFGCSAKRKLTESSAVNTENITEALILQANTQDTQSYSLGIDSAKQTNFLKLYPKGDFVISKDGFQGSADSLIWYSNLQQVSRNQQLEQQRREQSNREVHKQAEKRMVKEQKKDLAKIGSSFWWFVGCGILLLLLMLHYRRLRMA
ncbi:hypothetical protein [Pedobacter ureilyticus]|uniref:Lipoprotein n=1 Tax=Pedobacter ureilyticus TaxID=1393051 RepID=A0ABW9J7V8_9SPHI|nr:hypothetical protein [Pedobacter helvus]